jgi:hypothetical protein
LIWYDFGLTLDDFELIWDDYEFIWGNFEYVKICSNDNQVDQQIGISEM